MALVEGIAVVIDLFGLDTTTLLRRSRRSAVMAYMVPAGASGIDATAAFPLGSPSAADRFGAAFALATAFRGVIAGSAFAALVRAARFRPGSSPTAVSSPR
jgi:hypothetical protein